MVLVMNSSCSGVNRGVGRYFLARDVRQNDGKVVRTVVVAAVSLSGRLWCLFGQKNDWRRRRNRVRLVSERKGVKP